MLIITFLTFLLMARAMGLGVEANLSLSAFHGNPDLENEGVISARGGCQPATSVEVSSPFYRNASMDALRRLGTAVVNGTLLQSISQFSSFLHESCHDIAAKYDHFAKHMQSSLNKTWENYPELCPNLAQADPLSKALIYRGNQIENCLKQVKPDTTWMAAPCLHDLLQGLRNDGALWYAPNGTKLDWRVSLPFYEQWAADHAVLSVVELRTLGAVYSVMCGGGMKETEACTRARVRFRQSKSGFESFLTKQLGILYNATSGLYPIPERERRGTASLASYPNPSMSCRRVEYANAKGWVCDDGTWTALAKNISKVYCSASFNNDKDLCFVTFQTFIESFDMKHVICTSALSRISTYHQNPFQHAVAAAYSTSLAPFYTLQKRLMDIMLDWYKRATEMVIART